MQMYDVITLPLAERDIIRNVDYIFYEKQTYLMENQEMQVDDVFYI